MNWYALAHSEQLLSPALLFYPERIEKNIQKMISIAGSPDRLRPHIKTFKCAEIVECYQKYSIHKFKCATLMEAEVLAKSKARDVLIAYPMVGPNCEAFVKLMDRYPNTQFSALLDSKEHIASWAPFNRNIAVFIDIDCGMGRTGIKPKHLKELYSAVRLSNLKFCGFHAYDGHIHDQLLEPRTTHVQNTFKQIEPIIRDLISMEVSSAEFICGGSITFPIHAHYPERQLAPGTTVLWDYGYQQNYPDLKFEIAAAVFTRVISKIDDDKICLDLGHKAVASEMSGIRVFFPDLPESEMIGHSEEHLVLQLNSNAEIEIGQSFIGFPWHICPTVALHEKAILCIKNHISGSWNISGRKRNYVL